MICISRSYLKYAAVPMIPQNFSLSEVKLVETVVYDLQSLHIL